MLLSFQSFQIVLALALIAGLVWLSIPVLRFARYAGVPVVSVVFLLLPIVNAFWLMFLVAKRNSATVGSGR